MLNSELLHITLCRALEKAGVRFYSSCLKSAEDPEVQSLLREFVKIEEGHVRRLTKLMAEHGGRGYLWASSALALPADVLAAVMGRLWGLRLACRLEREGVNFYRRLPVQDKPLEEVIKKILTEEEMQVQRLGEVLRRCT